MHSLVDRLNGLLKGAFEELLMVGVPVMMSHPSFGPLMRLRSDIFDSPGAECQHVVGGLQVKHPPLASHRQVDGRGVSHDASRGPIEGGDVRIIRAGSSGRDPGVFVDSDLGVEIDFVRGLALLHLIDHLSIHHDLKTLNGKGRFHARADIDGAAPAGRSMVLPMGCPSTVRKTNGPLLMKVRPSFMCLIQLS